MQNHIMTKLIKQKGCKRERREQTFMAAKSLNSVNKAKVEIGGPAEPGHLGSNVGSNRGRRNRTTN